MTSPCAQPLSSQTGAAPRPDAAVPEAWKAARRPAEDNLHGCEASACCLSASRSSVRGSWHRGNRERDLVRVSVKQFRSGPRWAMALADCECRRDARSFHARIRRDEPGSCFCADIRTDPRRPVRAYGRHQRGSSFGRRPVPASAFTWTLSAAASWPRSPDPVRSGSSASRGPGRSAHRAAAGLCRATPGHWPGTSSSTWNPVTARGLARAGRRIRRPRPAGDTWSDSRAVEGAGYGYPI